MKMEYMEEKKQTIIPSPGEWIRHIGSGNVYVVIEKGKSVEADIQIVLLFVNGDLCGEPCAGKVYYIDKHELNNYFIVEPTDTIYLKRKE